MLVITVVGGSVIDVCMHMEHLDCTISNFPIIQCCMWLVHEWQILYHAHFAHADSLPHHTLTGIKHWSAQCDAAFVLSQPILLF